MNKISKNLQKLAMGISTIAIFAISFGLPAMGAGNAAPKATGGVGYTAGYQRYAEFNAIQTAGDCTTWIAGNNTIVLGDPFSAITFNVTFILNGTTLTGALTDNGFSTTPMAITGTLIGNTITFSYTYPDGGYRGTRTFTGTINSAGFVTGGTWSETGTEGLSGTWTNGAAFTSISTTCTGKGVFNYHDINGLYYKVDIQYVVVDGNTSWFAGPVISGNVGVGNWLFAKVQDLGTPGSAGDLIWGSFVVGGEDAAKAYVISKSTPADGPFAVTSGNLVVH